MSNPVDTARSLLFVPGDRPERFVKAVRSGADAVILDLEDSVPLHEKARARKHIAVQWPALLPFGVPLVVRINAPSSAAWDQDLQWLASLASLAAVMVPKPESARALSLVRESCGASALLPLIESAAGWQALDEIARASGVSRLVVGHIDFMADTGLRCSDDGDEAELAPLRFAVAMATRLAGLAPAIDGVTVQTDDLQRVTADALRSRRFGFGGKLCIHPRQIDAVHAALSPTTQEVAWARRVVEADAASHGAAVQLDGRMVDAPVVLQARRTLASALR